MAEPEFPVDLLPDGRVKLAMPKSVITLRRPLLGQLRELHEQLEEVNDGVRDLLSTYPTKPTAPVRTDEHDDETFAQAHADYVTTRAEWREQTRKITAEMDDLRAGWMRQVVEALGNGRLPDVPVGELPTWMVDTATAVALVNHWQTVPLARGGR